jgi:hypothetical protein
MPYIVTTKRELEDDGMGRAWFERVSRHAVATLDEARETALRAVGERRDMYYCEMEDAVPESGGTVGPLPDGTVIEVEQRSRNWLADRLGGMTDEHVWPAKDDATLQRQCNAYHARQA